MTEKHQCEGRVSYGDWGRSKQCSKTGAYEHEGRHYCKTHHPPTVKENQEKRRAQWNAEWEAKRAERVRVAAEMAERQRRAECFPDLLEALKGLDEAYCRAGSPLTRDERFEDRKRLIAARAAIARATGETA